MVRLAWLVVATACTTARVDGDVSYDDRFADTKLDVYMPDDGASSHPTVMFIHGGSWRSGDKSIFWFDAQRLAASGYTVASINYRLLPSGVFPNDVQDCLCALAFLRAHAADYAIDPDRIAVMGYSSGAQQAGLVGIAADRPELAPDCDAAGGQPIAPPAAAIPASGPMDMRLFYNEVSTDSVADVFGGTPDELPQAYDLGSPIFYVRPGVPPFLLLVDAIDIGGVYDMRHALAAAGDDVRLLQITGSAHVLEQGDDPGIYEAGTSNDTPEAWIAIDDFLTRTIGSER
jgi:acetyl esterase/lipase